MNTLVLFLLNLAMGAFFLFGLLTNSIVARAENLPAVSDAKPHQTEIKAQSFKSSELNKQPLVVESEFKQTQKVELKGMKVGPSKSSAGDAGKTYDVKISPIKKAQTVNPSQNNTSVTSGTIEAKPIPSTQKVEQKFEVSPQLGPVQRISPLTQEQGDGAVKVKITEPLATKPIPLSKDSGVQVRTTDPTGPVQVIEADRNQQESFEKRIKVTGEKQIKFPENPPQGEPQSRYTSVVGPTRAIDAEKAAQVQTPIRHRVQVSENIRAWKLDESGQKTDQETTIRVIEQVKEPKQNR